MKTIIAGSRDITNDRILSFLMEQVGWPVTEVVSGTSRGVDRMGERWAKERDIELTQFPAEWDEYGKAAGPIRNTEMAKYADAAIIIWDGYSKGTRDMLSKARAHNLKLVCLIIDD